MNQERYQQELDPKHTARSVVSRSIAIGALSGLVGILCCVSPVVLVLLGLTTATAAISLGDTLYYDYGWYFRGAAVVFAGRGLLLANAGQGLLSAQPATDFGCAARHHRRDSRSSLRGPLLVHDLSSNGLRVALLRLRLSH